MKYVLLGVARSSNENLVWKGEKPLLIKVIITFTEKAINKLKMGAEKHPKKPICWKPILTIVPLLNKSNIKMRKLITCNVVSNCNKTANKQQNRNPKNIREKEENIHHHQHQVDNPNTAHQNPPNFEHHEVQSVSLLFVQDDIDDAQSDGQPQEQVKPGRHAQSEQEKADGAE